MSLFNNKTPNFVQTLALCGMLSASWANQAMAIPSDDVLVSFEGPWMITATSETLKTLDGKPLPLLPEAKKVYEQNQALKKKGENSYDPLARCLPAGVTRLYNQGTPFRMAIGDRFAGMFFESQHLFRVITMYQGHYEAIAPAYQGQAVGEWDGNTLVVDTDQFNDITLLDAAGLPHSDELHTVERISVRPDGKLHIEMTLTDPQTFSEPVKTEFVFDKKPGLQFEVDYCLQREGLI